ncbi:MAG: hypothetical protein JNK09_18960 [Prolixibacteraceae bacterium]|nr:hypothetical protein [Prolixibacteraceae bacterium]
MKILNYKNNRYFPGLWLLLIGLLLFVLLFTPMRTFSIIGISLAAIYIAVSSYAKFSNTDKHPFRSRARDRIYKDHDEIN